MSVILRKIAYKAVLLIKSCYCYFVALISYFAGTIDCRPNRQDRLGRCDLLVSDLAINIFLDAIETKKILEAVNCVLAHRLKIFDNKYIDVTKTNSKPKDLFGKYRPIDWHRDFKSGYVWNKLSMPEFILRYLPTSYGADIRWPWELSRFQYATALAIATCFKEKVKSEDEYWNEFKDQITDWINNNPSGLGVNWVTPMDVSMRTVSWLITFILFNNKYDCNNIWYQKFFNSLCQHALFLYNKRSTKLCERKGNHYATQIAGLYLVSSLYPTIKGSVKWRSFAKKQLEKQILEQVRPDGSHFEDSTLYHLLVTEIFLYTGILADSLGDSFSVEYRNTVGEMVNVIKKIASSRYDIPQIGDNDDGYFIKPVFMDETHTRAGHILNLGEQYINHKIEIDLNKALIDIILVKKQEVPRKSPADPPPTYVFEDAGWVVLEEGPIKIIMCVGNNGVECRGGHSHEDILSFTLYWKGLPVIVDPGTYVYTPDRYMRNKFRYAMSHNQPQYEIGEKEWSNNNVFSKTYAPATEYSINDENKQKAIYAEARYENYIAKRAIKIDKGGNGIAIYDELDGSMPGRGVVSLCLHPEVICKVCNNGQFELTVGEDKLVLESDGIFQKKKAGYSSGYGQITETYSLAGEVGNINLKLL